MNLQILWLLLCGSLIFFMQAGFTCFEGGFVQSKNVIAVTIENLLTFTITVILFCFVGFPFMFGESYKGIIGTSFWGLDFKGYDSNYGFAFLFVRVMFAAVAVTIFAGAMSERTRIKPLLIGSAVSAAFIYPIFGHWVWGSAFVNQKVWLAGLGYMDFAGASVVHTTAGFISLAGLLVVGSRRKIRRGRSNIPLATLGVFILWFGWLGFNGTNATGTDVMGYIFINTLISASFGMTGSMMVNFIFKSKSGYMVSIFNGVLSGLVAITAMSEYCRPWGAIITGLVAGICAELVMRLLFKLKIDDVVNVIPTHLTGGIIGILLLPFLSRSDFLRCESVWQQFGVQLLGVAVNFVWAFGMAYAMFRLIDKVFGIRVSADEEKKGLNMVEFHDIYAWEKHMEISSYQDRITEQNKLLRKQARLLTVTEEQEKNRLARELHDSVGQSLSALKIIQGLNTKIAEKSGDEKIIASEKRAGKLVDDSISEIRNILNNLRPEHLAEGLEAGLRYMAESIDSLGGLKCSLKVEDEIPFFDETYTLNIYRLVQEAVTNVVKHAEAGSCRIVCTSRREGFYTFMVEDDGKGFDVSGASQGIGLSSMGDRARMLGGSIKFISEEGKGTEVVIEVPTDYE